MNIELLRETFSPWIDDVIRDFSKCLSDYGTDMLQSLHKNIEKEIYTVYFSSTKSQSLVLKRAKTLYSALTYLYNHFCWKVAHQMDCPNVKTSSVKLLSQIIKTGLILSKGQPKSEWINRILTAIRLFTGDPVLIYDALLLVNLLKRKYHKAYIVVLKHVLTNEDQPMITEPLVYMKVILLFRRLKALLKNSYTKNCVTLIAAKIKPPANLISWLMSLDVSDMQPLKYKTIAKALMRNRMPEALLKKIRCIALSSYEVAPKPAAAPEIFIIDSPSLNDLTKNRQIRERKKLDSALEPNLRNKSKMLSTSKSTKNVKKTLLKEKKKESPKSDYKGETSASYINNYSNLVIEKDACDYEVCNNSGSVSSCTALKPIDSCSFAKPNRLPKYKNHSNKRDFVSNPNEIEVLTITDSESAVEEEYNKIASSKTSETNSGMTEKSSIEVTNSKNSKRIKKKNISNTTSEIKEEKSLIKSNRFTSSAQKDPLFKYESESFKVESNHASEEIETFYIDTVPKKIDLESDPDKNQNLLDKKRKSLQDKEFLFPASSKKKKSKHKKSSQSSVSNSNNFSGDQLLERGSSTEFGQIEMDVSKQPVQDESIKATDQNNKKVRDHCIDQQILGGNSLSVDSDKINITPDSSVSNFSENIKNSNVMETVHTENSSVFDSSCLNKVNKCNKKDVAQKETNANDDHSSETVHQNKQFLISVFDKSPSTSWLLNSSKLDSILENEKIEKFDSNQQLMSSSSPKKLKSDSISPRLTSVHSTLSNEDKDFHFEKLGEIPVSTSFALNASESKTISPSKGLKRKSVDSDSEKDLDNTSLITENTHPEPFENLLTMKKELKLSSVREDNFKDHVLNKPLQSAVLNCNVIDSTSPFADAYCQNENLNTTLADKLAAPNYNVDSLNLSDTRSLVFNRLSVQPEISESSNAPANTDVVNKKVSSAQNVLNGTKEMVMNDIIEPDSTYQTNPNVSEHKLCSNEILVNELTPLQLSYEIIKHDPSVEGVSNDKVESSIFSTKCQISAGEKAVSAENIDVKDLPQSSTLPKSKLPVKEAVAFSSSTNECENSGTLNHETVSLNNKSPILELEYVGKSDTLVKNSVTVPQKDIPVKQFNLVTNEADKNNSLENDKFLSLAPSNNEKEIILTNSFMKSSVVDLECVDKADEVIKSCENIPQKCISDNHFSQVSKETDENNSLDKCLPLSPSRSKEPISNYLSANSSVTLTPPSPKSCIALQLPVLVDFRNNYSEESINSEICAKGCESSVPLKSNESDKFVSKSQSNFLHEHQHITTKVKELPKICLNSNSLAKSDMTKSVGDPFKDSCEKSISYPDTAHKSISHHLDQEQERNNSNKTCDEDLSVKVPENSVSDVNNSNTIQDTDCTEIADSKLYKIDTSAFSEIVSSNINAERRQSSKSASSDTSVLNHKSKQPMDDGFLYSNNAYIIIDEAECQSDDNFSKNGYYDKRELGIAAVVSEALKTGDKATEGTDSSLLECSQKNKAGAENECVKNSGSRVGRFKKLSVTQHNKNSNKDVHEVMAECSRLTRSSSKKYPSLLQSVEFPLNLKKDDFLSFADISSSIKSRNNCDSPSKSKTQIENFAFAASTELFCSYRFGKVKTTMLSVSKDDNSSHCNEQSDDERSHDLSSDESVGKTFPDHSSPDVNDDNESENIQEKQLASNSTKIEIKSPEKNIKDISYTETCELVSNENKHIVATNIETYMPCDSKDHQKPMTNTHQLPARKSVRLSKKSDSKCETLSEEPLDDNVSKSQQIMDIPVAEIKKDSSETTIPVPTTSDSGAKSKDSSETTIPVPTISDSGSESKKDPSELIDKNINPVCVIEKLDIYPYNCKKSAGKCLSRKTKSKEIPQKTLPKRYSLRCHEPKQYADESSNLGIDISQLHLDSPNSRKSLRNYTKMDEKVLAKLQIADSDLEKSTVDDDLTQQEISSSVDKPSEENMPCYNLRNRKPILAPTKFK